MNRLASLALLGGLWLPSALISWWPRIARAESPPIEPWTRTRTSTVEERRELLLSIGAEVPDKQGKFDPKKKARPDLDWLTAVQGVNTPAAEDIRSDVAFIRERAARRIPAEHLRLLEWAFDPETLPYRDEIGRQLRNAAPFSLPALITASKRSGDLGRYANYQLERLDRQDPKKAITAASVDPELRAAVIVALGEAGNRDAVPTIFQLTRHDDRSVRAAARQAWNAYVAGPPPPPAPRQFLKLPGGKLSPKKEPLWLTYRELAVLELSKATQELFGEALPKNADLTQISARIYAHHDQARLAAARQELERLTSASNDEQLRHVEEIEQLLRRHPDLAPPAIWPELLRQVADRHAERRAFESASSYYLKAATAAAATTQERPLLAAYHHALGKSLESKGLTGTSEFAKAVELDPSLSVAKSAQGDKRTSSTTLALILSGALAIAIAILLVVRELRRAA